MKHEWRKKEKAFYLPKAKPELVEIPRFTFVSIQGSGNPGGEDFGRNVEALYTFSYGVRMSYKWPAPPDEYYEYTVYPLEGIWDLAHPEKKNGPVDKDDLIYRVMIRQPDFFNEELFGEIKERISKKKDLPEIENLEIYQVEEGPCVQMLHKGSFDSEPESFALMQNFCEKQGLVRQSMQHREIYLSDPRKVTEDKLKTVLRFQVD
jgi:hypothetical protein